MLTSRITATSNAVFTVENMFVWNVLPPCIATVSAIAADWNRQPADGGGPARGRRRSWCWRCSAWRPPESRCMTTSPTRPPPSTARWSMSSTICRWCGRSAASATSTTASTRTVDREMVARGRSLRYLEKLRLMHAGVTVVLTDRAARLGDHAVAARRGDHRRRRAGLHAGTFDPERDARPRRRAGRRHPAFRAPDRGDRDPAAAARIARSSRGRAAGQAAARRSPSTMSPSAIPAGPGVRAFQPAHPAGPAGRPGRASPAAANPRCSRCCSASTTSSRAAS